MSPIALLRRRYAHPRSRVRSGLSLVEVLVVVALMSVLLATMTSIAVRLRQWDRQMRDNSVHSDQLTALAESLRSDATSGAELKLVSKDTLAIEGTDRRETRYTLRPDGCQREVKSADSKSRSANMFTIGRFETWKLEPGPTGRHSAYAISLAHSDSEQAIARVPLFVYAVLNGKQPK